MDTKKQSDHRRSLAEQMRQVVKLEEANTTGELTNEDRQRIWGKKR
jgi:hypothetical protein